MAWRKKQFLLIPRFSPALFQVALSTPGPHLLPSRSISTGTWAGNRRSHSILFYPILSYPSYIIPSPPILPIPSLSSYPIPSHLISPILSYPTPTQSIPCHPNASSGTERTLCVGGIQGCTTHHLYPQPHTGQGSLQADELSASWGVGWHYPMPSSRLLHSLTPEP